MRRGQGCGLVRRRPPVPPCAHELRPPLGPALPHVPADALRRLLRDQPVDGRRGRRSIASARSASGTRSSRRSARPAREIEVLEPQPGLPDLVFTANLGIVDGDTFVAARMRHPERRRRAAHAERWFRAHGFDGPPPAARTSSQEGAGDALPFGDTLVAGYRSRSSAASYVDLARIVDGRDPAGRAARPALLPRRHRLLPAGRDAPRCTPPARSTTTGARAIAALVPDPIALTDDEAARVLRQLRRRRAHGRHARLHAAPGARAARARLRAGRRRRLGVPQGRRRAALPDARARRAAWRDRAACRPSAAARARRGRRAVAERSPRTTTTRCRSRSPRAEGAWVHDDRGRRYLDALSALLGAELRPPPPAARRRGARAARPRDAHEPRVLQRPARAVRARAGRADRQGPRAADEHRRRGRRDRDQGRAQVGLRASRACAPGGRRSSSATATSTAARRRSSRSPTTRSRATASARSRRASCACRSATRPRWRAALRDDETSSPSSSSRSRARPASSCRPTATCARRGGCAPSTACCSSPTRSSRASAAPAARSPATTRASCPTSTSSARRSAAGSSRCRRSSADDEVLGVFTPGSHGSTFGGNPLACAVGRAVLELLRTRRAAGQRGARWATGCAPASTRPRRRRCAAVRSRGLWFGLDLGAAQPSARAVCERLLERGRARKDTHERTIRLAPPLTITDGRGRLAARAAARGARRRRHAAPTARACARAPPPPHPAILRRIDETRPPHRRRAARGRPAEPRRARRAREPVLAGGQAARRPAARARRHHRLHRARRPGGAGQGTEAFVEIHCAANMSPIALRETLAGEPEIVAAYTVTGDADALVQVRATDVAHLEATVERIRANPGIARTKTIIVSDAAHRAGVERVVAREAARSVRRRQTSPGALRHLPPLRDQSRLSHMTDETTTRHHLGNSRMRRAVARMRQHRRTRRLMTTRTRDRGGIARQRACRDRRLAADHEASRGRERRVLGVRAAAGRWRQSAVPRRHRRQPDPRHRARPGQRNRAGRRHRQRRRPAAARHDRRRGSRRRRAWRAGRLAAAEDRLASRDRQPRSGPTSELPVRRLRPRDRGLLEGTDRRADRRDRHPALIDDPADAGPSRCLHGRRRRGEGARTSPSWPPPATSRGRSSCPAASRASCRSAPATPWRAGSARSARRPAWRSSRPGCTIDQIDSAGNPFCCGNGTSQASAFASRRARRAAQLRTRADGDAGVAAARVDSAQRPPRRDRRVPRRRPRRDRRRRHRGDPQAAAARAAAAPPPRRDARTARPAAGQARDMAARRPADHAARQPCPRARGCTRR